MNQKYNVIKYMTFCGEKRNRDCATCLRIFSNYICLLNIWNLVA